ncbi:MAG: hypothetical protein AAGA69_03400 [Pseudomonadota bacterium]
MQKFAMRSRLPGVIPADVSHKPVGWAKSSCTLRAGFHFGKIRADLYTVVPGAFAPLAPRYWLEHTDPGWIRMRGPNCAIAKWQIVVLKYIIMEISCHNQVVGRSSVDYQLSEWFGE